MALSVLSGVILSLTIRKRLRSYMVNAILVNALSDRLLTHYVSSSMRRPLVRIAHLKTWRLARATRIVFAHLHTWRPTSIASRLDGDRTRPFFPLLRYG
jgi:hypothetical protein